MAQQKGIVKLRGTLDDITFMRTKDGYRAQVKSSLSKERVATDPIFLRTRENGQEFGRAGKSGKVLRHAFKEIFGKGAGRMTARMQKTMMQCLKGDTTSDRGMRKVSSGALGFLQDFNFHPTAVLSNVLAVTPTTTVNRTTGSVAVAVPIFVPTSALSFPAGATHYRFVAAASEVDFDAETYHTVSANSTYGTIDSNASSAVTLNLSLTANSTLPIFVVLGIHFYQEVNGTQYALNSGTTDAVTIIKVDQ